MKFIFILCLSVLLISTEQNPKNDWAKLNLKGTVKSIFESVEFAQDSSEMGGIPSCNKEFKFDKRGYQIKFALFAPKSHSSVIQVKNAVFDKHGNETSEFTMGRNGEVRDSTLTEYKYDQHARLIKKSVTASNINGTQTEIYKYDSLGRIKEIDHLTFGGPYLGKSIYTYSDKNIKTRKDFDTAGRLNREVLYADNSSDNLKEEDIFNADGTKIITTRCSYDSIGNLIIWDDFTDPQGIRKFTMTYDSKNNLTQREVLTIIDKKEYRLAERFQYEYDNRGNWIQKKSFSNDTLGQVLGEI